VEELNFLQLYKAFLSVSEYVSYVVYLGEHMSPKQNSPVVFVALITYHTLSAFRGLSCESCFSEICRIPWEWIEPRHLTELQRTPRNYHFKTFSLALRFVS